MICLVINFTCVCYNKVNGIESQAHLIPKMLQEILLIIALKSKCQYLFVSILLSL